MPCALPAKNLKTPGGNQSAIETTSVPFPRSHIEDGGPDGVNVCPRSQITVSSSHQCLRRHVRVRTSRIRASGESSGDAIQNLGVSKVAELGGALISNQNVFLVNGECQSERDRRRESELPTGLMSR